MIIKIKGEINDGFESFTKGMSPKCTTTFLKEGMSTKTQRGLQISTNTDQEQPKGKGKEAKDVE